MPLCLHVFTFNFCPPAGGLTFNSLMLLPSFDNLEDLQNLVPDVKKKNHPQKKLLPFFIIFILFISLLSAFVTAVYQLAYKNKIYPGVRIGYYNVGGQTRLEADRLLSVLTEKVSKDGLIYIAKTGSAERQIIVPTLFVSPSDPDLTREILTFDFDSTINRAWQAGRSGSFLQKLRAQARLLLLGQKIPLAYALNQEFLKQSIKEKISELENPGVNAKLSIHENVVTVIPEKPGNSFDYNRALVDTKFALESLIFHPVTLNLKADVPEIRAADAIIAAAKAKHIFGFASTTLFYEDKAWPLENSDLATLLEFKLASSGSVIKKIRRLKEITVGLNHASTTAFLQTIAKEIDIPAVDAKFELASTTGHLKATFQPSSNGKKLNLEKTFAKLEKEIIENDNHEIGLEVDIARPRVDLASINSYGIKELVAIGESNFKGSPVNRRHNIKNGAEKLNGVLISPGEEFSLVDAIGPVDAFTGFLPELVIKGNKTAPEYGGGLCQIGTTAFRVALNAGLPITERRPHSYRVVYYEPAGMDATIYGPHPDLKFINDTGNYLVLATEIEGDILRFKFYGQKDNRQIYVENPPRIWNITYPGPAKIIETADLPPGQKKCTESSHQGADTEFVRRVTYPGLAEPKEEKFFSRYRAWQAVCLLGVEKLSTSTEDVVE